jgi:hypothetical protein
MTSTQSEQKPKPDKHVTTFYVDNEPLTTDQKELTVREILTKAGDDPNTHYVMELRGDQQIPHKDLDESIKIHEGMRFAAIFTGNTPVSSK